MANPVSQQDSAGGDATDTTHHAVNVTLVSPAPTSNSASGMATSATNVPAVVFNYGFNGTTWDQLQVDGAKGLVVGGANAIGTASTGNPAYIGGIFETTPATLTTGQRGAAHMTSHQEILSSVSTGGLQAIVTGATSDGLAASLAGLIVNSFSRVFNGASFDRQYSGSAAAASATPGIGAVATEEVGRPYNNITTATTTLVKSGSGFLHLLSINTPVASATITIYDSLTATGTKIGTFTLPSVITGLGPYSIPLDVRFATGLTIVTSGATDITAVYR